MAIDLDKLEALHAKATSGEWASRREGSGYEHEDEFLSEIGDGVQVSGTAICVAWSERVDSEFIAASHNAMPALLAELRLLREFERRVRSRWPMMLKLELCWLDEQRKAE